MANTNKGRKISVCATPQAADLTAVQFAALTWVEVTHVGSIGQTGTDTNIVDYDELNTTVTQKMKGISNAGDPVVECARFPTDPGQNLLRTAGTTKFYYAFKIEDSDAPDANSINTIYYQRGLVTGPIRPGGRNEDFIIENFTLGLVQQEVVVNSSGNIIPTINTLPYITGTAIQTGQVLTCSTGVWNNNPNSFAYQWQHDTAGNGTFTNIAAATSSTFTCVVGDVGNQLRCQVVATNSAGSSTAASSLGTQKQV